MRDDAFRSPVVAGMARTSLKELTRDRVLTDDEIRSIWTALDACTPDAYVRIVRALLLSATRLNEAARLQWPEIDCAAFTVPASRCKTKIDHVVPVTASIATLIGERADGAGEFVFSTDGGFSPFSGFSKAKRRLDKKINDQRRDAGLMPMPGWRLHDLRRTARSLMPRAGVTSDVAERILGHVLPGVRGVYDRHEYFEEKRDGLQRLERLVKIILHPPTEDIAPTSDSR